MAAEGAGDLIRVVALLGAAVIAVPLFKRLGLGSVLGYLAAGLIIGPFGLHIINDPSYYSFSRIWRCDVPIRHWTGNETLSFMGTTPTNLWPR